MKHQFTCTCGSQVLISFNLHRFQLVVDHALPQCKDVLTMTPVEYVRAQKVRAGAPPKPKKKKKKKVEPQ